jgi:hypothetical protein
MKTSKNKFKLNISFNNQIYSIEAATIFLGLLLILPIIMMSIGK